MTRFSQPPARDFAHPQIDVEVTAIGGHYVFTREARLDFQGRPVLYFVGYGVFDTTCCGAGGCGYALVAGEAVAPAYRRDAAGRPVSRVVPIVDERQREEIRRRITAADPVSQVVFET